MPKKFYRIDPSILKYFDGWPKKINLKNVLSLLSSDVDKKQCCKTPPLKSALSNEWKANSKATLGEAFFGPCNGTKFLVSWCVELPR